MAHQQCAISTQNWCAICRPFPSSGLCTLPCHASLNQTCIILVCASCHDYVMVVYYVVCFFPVSLLRVSFVNVAFVRIRSTTPVCLLHGLVLLPCRISGKMTIPSKSLLSLLAQLLALLLCLCCDTYHLLIMPPILLNQASRPTLSQQTVVWLCYRFAQPLLQRCQMQVKIEVGSLLEHGDVVPGWNMFTC